MTEVVNYLRVIKSIDFVFPLYLCVEDSLYVKINEDVTFASFLAMRGDQGVKYEIVFGKKWDFSVPGVDYEQDIITQEVFQEAVERLTKEFTAPLQ